VIAAGLICTCRHDLVARRLGHLALVAWASVSLWSAIGLYARAASNLLLVSVVVMAACWVCVLLRAAWGWTPRREGLPTGAEAASAVTSSSQSAETL
jgi:hypothetical protein